MKVMKKIGYYLAAVFCMGFVAFAANELHPDAYAAVSVDCATKYSGSPAKIAKCGTCRAQSDTDQAFNECMDGSNEKNDLYGNVRTIINWIVMVVGIVAVIMIILGGIFYVISAGDPGKIKKAKDTILYGIIGLVIVLLAFAIVNFVLGILE